MAEAKEKAAASPAPPAAADNIDKVESQDLPKDTALEAKKWGLEPPEILRHLTVEERAVLEKKLRRKIDFRLLPMIIVMYILNYIDR